MMAIWKDRYGTEEAVIFKLKLSGKNTEGIGK